MLSSLTQPLSHCWGTLSLREGRRLLPSSVSGLLCLYNPLNANSVLFWNIYSTSINGFWAEIWGSSSQPPANNWQEKLAQRFWIAPCRRKVKREAARERFLCADPSASAGGYLLNFPTVILYQFCQESNIQNDSEGEELKFVFHFPAYLVS